MLRDVYRVRILSIFLAVALAFTMSPATAFAVSDSPLMASSFLSESSESGSFEYGGATWTYNVTAGVEPESSATAQLTGYTLVEGADSLEIPSTIPASATDNIGMSICAVADDANVLQAPVKKLIIGDGLTIPGTSNKNTVLEELVIGDDVTFSYTYNRKIGGVFQGCTNLKTVSVGDNLSVAKFMFRADKLLETAVVGNGSNSNGMFIECSALHEVSLASTEVIPAQMFDQAGITSFDFSKTVSIGGSAFSQSKLEGELVFSENLTELQGSSFVKTEITSVVIPPSVASLGQSAFSGCTNLESAEINCNTAPLAFAGTKALKSIVIGESVTEMDATTFSDGSTDATVSNFSSTMKYENGILSNADDSEVYPCMPSGSSVEDTLTPSNLTIDENGQATIKSTITTIWENAFANCASVSSFTIEEGNASFILDQGILYDINKTTLYKAPNTLTSVTVPASVTKIAWGAFYGCTNLASVEFESGSSLAVIGHEAFRGCSLITEINLPDSVTDLGDGVFEGTSLTGFTAGSALWGNSAVKKSLADFVAEGGVPSINSLWYGWNWSAIDWSSESLNSSVTALDFSSYASAFVPHYAFAGLTGIAEISLPAKVSEIGNGAFYFCSNLKDVYIYNPDAITIATSSGGTGDSGSGDANESYAVSQPGSFSWWNPNKQSDASTGAKYEDYTGLNFYGAAYSGNNLVKFCQNMQHNFIPVVILDNLAAAANPFATDAQTEYDLTYGEGANDYGYVAIADIQAGGTPAVMAYFGDYGTPRDLTNDSACMITYYGPDGKATTTFTNAGTYTAFIEGDGKSVFGERTVSFQVKGADNPPAPAPAEKAVSLSSAAVSGVSGKTYTGKAQTQSPVVKVGGKTLVAGTDYTVAYKNNVNAGTATMTITGKGKYTGSKSVTFAIAKASQKISAKSFKVTYKGGKLIKEGKLAKARTIKVKGKAKVSAKTAVKFKKANKAGGKKIKVNAKTGKITVKKGLKAGTYKVKVKITAAEGANYKAAKAKTITVRVIVKNK